MADVKDTTVQVGGKKIPAKLIGGVTYAELRPLIEALKLTVTWDVKTGAGVNLGQEITLA